MKKISAADATIVLSEASEAIRSLYTERDQLSVENSELRQKVAGYEIGQRVEKLSSRMEEKGLADGLNEDERLAMLREKAASGKLDVFEQAIDLAASDSPLGKVSKGPSGPSRLGSLADVLYDL